MKSNPMQLDYRVYRLARLLSESLDLGELVAISVGALDEDQRGQRRQELPGHFSAYLT